jgi:hypothetical protein
MKKYLFGMLAITLALCFSAFKTASPLTLTHEFTLDATPISAAIITDQSSGVYENWVRTGSGLVTCDLSADQRACKIAVDAKYTRTVGSDILLNATDPDGAGSKEAFPMSATTGLNNGTQYYKVNTTEVPSEIDVRNGTVN